MFTARPDALPPRLRYRNTRYTELRSEQVQHIHCRTTRSTSLQGVLKDSSNSVAKTDSTGAQKVVQSNERLSSRTRRLLQHPTAQTAREVCTAPISHMEILLSSETASVQSTSSSSSIDSKSETSGLEPRRERGR